MSATVDYIKDSCVLCEAVGEKQATADSVMLKLKGKKFQGVVCLKHMIQLLKGNGDGNEKKKLEAQNV